MEKENELKYKYKYPHPAVTCDCVVFGFDGKQLNILLIKRGLEPYKGEWALPGGFVRIDESCENCAMRELKEETNMDNDYLRQFGTFSEPKRDPRERVITVAYYALVSQSKFNIIGGDDAVDAQWFSVKNLPYLAFDHSQILSKARQQLKEDLHFRPVGIHLLDELFTMTELQNLFESILEERFDRRNFYKKMHSLGIVSEVNEEIKSNGLLDIMYDVKLSECAPKSSPITGNSFFSKVASKFEKSGCSSLVNDSNLGNLQSDEDRYDSLENDSSQRNSRSGRTSTLLSFNKKRFEEILKKKSGEFPL